MPYSGYCITHDKYNTLAMSSDRSAPYCRWAWANIGTCTKENAVTFEHRYRGTCFFHGFVRAENGGHEPRPSYFSSSRHLYVVPFNSRVR